MLGGLLLTAAIKLAADGRRRSTTSGCRPPCATTRRLLAVRDDGRLRRRQDHTRPPALRAVRHAGARRDGRRLLRDQLDPGHGTTVTAVLALR